MVQNSKMTWPLSQSLLDSEAGIGRLLWADSQMEEVAE